MKKKQRKFTKVVIILILNQVLISRVYNVIINKSQSKMTQTPTFLPKSLLRTIYEIQTEKYKRKGLKNIFIAVFLLFTIIVGGTHLGRRFWPEHIVNPETFVGVTTLIIYFSFHFLYFLIYLPGYKGNEWYKKYQINKELSKPWQRKNWPEMRLRTIFYVFLNKGIVFPILFYGSMKMNGTKARFDNFPTSYEVFSQLLTIIVIQDFFSFVTHKLSHDIPFMYKFHKIHHQIEFPTKWLFQGQLKIYFIQFDLT